MDNHFHAGPSSAHTETHRLSFQLCTTIHRTELGSANVQNNDTNKHRYDLRSACNPPWPHCDWLNNIEEFIFKQFLILACCLLAESPWRTRVTFFIIIMDVPTQMRGGEEGHPRALLHIEPEGNNKISNVYSIFEFTAILFFLCVY